MNPRDSGRVAHILEAAARTDAIVSHGKAAFEASWVIQAAAVHQVALIGEAANQLSEEFLMRFPSVPWAEIVAARNFVIHEYQRVDLDQIWVILEDRIPELVHALTTQGPDAVEPSPPLPEIEAPDL